MTLVIAKRRAAESQLSFSTVGTSFCRPLADVPERMLLHVTRAVARTRFHTCTSCTELAWFPIAAQPVYVTTCLHSAGRECATPGSAGECTNGALECSETADIPGGSEQCTDSSEILLPSVDVHAYRLCRIVASDLHRSIIHVAHVSPAGGLFMRAKAALLSLCSSLCSRDASLG